MHTIVEKETKEKERKKEKIKIKREIRQVKATVLGS